jgi:hypothetical protein
MQSFDEDYRFSDKEIAEIVGRELPEWKQMCDRTDGEVVLFHQDAFGQSVKELLLMALGIKYARQTQKEIVIDAKRLPQS